MQVSELETDRQQQGLPPGLGQDISEGILLDDGVLYFTS